MTVHTIKVSEIDESVQRTHLLEPDEVLTLRTFAPSHGGGFLFRFNGENGENVGTIYDFQLPSDWVSKVMRNQRA